MQTFGLHEIIDNKATVTKFPEVIIAPVMMENFMQGSAKIKGSFQWLLGRAWRNTRSFQIMGW